ncbi:hypothetical protein C9374_004301 [Naegleria lovaniensis]|uniref:4-aminobutyrate--2-oxoglutarate transaminase n=1 Tax=Naegleria lovaniensis TaxID=51637 RepID=A0AA88KLG7_NAELO|nr:uncharacterized protein C9374_004301 [Naegleria lovaniensis]KAG2383630.1 hypothetical protein C9374_004301 [Naegleria lovaniensis]
MQKSISKHSVKSVLAKIASNQQRNFKLDLTEAKKPTHLLPDEYDGIKLVTPERPGPKTKELLERMNKIQDMRAAHFVANFEKSKGNFIVDADDNIILDTFTQISSIPLGYNHPYLIEKFHKDPRYATSFLNRPSLGINPPHNYIDILQESFARIMPKGMTDVVTLSSGAEANENAYKVAFCRYMQIKRGGKSASKEEMDSCVLNQKPGTPNLSILSFKNSFHGRTLGALTATHSKAIHKVDFPSFNWPVCDFPQLKYPLEQYEAENKKEMDRVLEQVEKTIKLSHSPNSPWGEVAGLVVEPIQSEGGDKHAMPYFFKELRRITKENNVAFICDEVQTGGGATGKFWAHEYWGLGENGPDIVCFSKKLQAAGIFHRPEFKIDLPYRIFNTWLGDYTRALQLGAIIDVIERDRLLDLVNQTGAYMMKHMTELSKRYPGKIDNVRGAGTFIAFESNKQPELMKQMLHRGVEVGSCGTNTIRLRPMLTFHQWHANIFLQNLNETLEKL